MTFIEHAAVVHVPLNMVYRQWCDPASYPNFMQGIDSVQALEPNTLVWSGDFFGHYRTWYTEAGTHIPNQLITWRTTSGPKQNMVIRFGYIDADTTRLTVQSIFEPADFLSPDTAAATISRRIADDLRRFKLFMETNGAEEFVYRTAESGMWR